MSGSSSAIPGDVRPKVQPYFDENSLFHRVVNIPRSLLNTTRKISLVSQAYGYSTWILSNLWRVTSWRLLRKKSTSKEESVDGANVVESSSEEVVLYDLASDLTVSLIEKMYLHFLEHNFLGITRESLELVRYESKVLQNLQDFELVKVLQSLFGSEANEENECRNESLFSFSTVKYFAWTATGVVWNSILSGITYYSPAIPWLFPKENPSGQLDCTTNGKEPSPSSNSQPSISVSSLLMCETNTLSQVIADSSSYAASSTHHLLKEAVLLFVPMEILNNTREILKNPPLSIAMSPLSAFWELFNYVSFCGMDMLEECNSMPEINYAVVEDDDFHFVVNMPKMRRPILFVGIR